MGGRGLGLGGGRRALAAVALAIAVAPAAMARPPGAATPPWAAAALQPGVVDIRLTPIADTTIDRLRAGEAFGSAPSLSLGRDVAPDGTTRTVLLRFGLPEMAPGSRVVTATLTLRRTGGVGAASVVGALASLSEPFDERTATWADRPDIARQGAAAYIPSTPGTLAFDVAWAVEEALRAQRHLGLQLEVPAGGCEARRSRTFASREDPSAPPELRLAYVGPGTPHPFPSPTATRTPTRTPSPTGPRPPTASPTPTSQRPQPAPMTVFEPAGGAVLPPPASPDVWVVRWRQHAPTLCHYAIALAGADGDVFVTGLASTRATCFAFDLALPGAPPSLPAGAYHWRIDAQCPPFDPQRAESLPFTLRTSLDGTAAPGVPATPEATPSPRQTWPPPATTVRAGAGPHAIWLPIAWRHGAAYTPAPAGRLRSAGEQPGQRPNRASGGDATCGPC